MSNGTRKLNDETTEAGAAINTVMAPAAHSGEGSAWFWRMFGGTIIGGITLLSVTLFNHLNNTISCLRDDIIATQKDHATLREKVVGFETSLTGAVEQNNKLGEERKTVVLETIKTLQASLTDLQTKVTALEQSKELDKERKLIIDATIKSLQDDLKELNKALADYREKQAEKAAKPPEVNLSEPPAS
jgi:DNA repair exonuclease SbcCD ATPase subunit